MEQQIAQWEQRGDRRAIFLGCYHLMTRNMIRAMEQGRFVDNIWVSSLLHHFAAYYFNALQQYDRNDRATPKVWHLAHQAAADPKTPAHQNLLLGVNAHINYDLVLALVDVLENEWLGLASEKRERRHSDHTLINRIIGDTTDSVQDQILERYEPAMKLVDVFMGPVDEWLASRLITSWRERVWKRAVEMLESADDDRREMIRQRIEKEALKRGRRILDGTL